MRDPFRTAITSIGQTYPLGATVTPGGVNFSLFSRHASAVELLFFDHVDDPRPTRVVPIDPVWGRTYHYWHVFVPGVESGQLYGYRVHGPFVPGDGLRFDPGKVLLDPYGRAVAMPEGYSREMACVQGDNSATAMKSVVADTSTYDWQGDLPLQRPATDTIVYEMHVRGFTQNSNSGVPAERRGTYLGVIDKIPYLQELGITAVELLPVFQFDPYDCPPGLVNYWGYAPVSFFAPHHAYSSRRDPLGAIDEFRDMVKALHQADIEVILDVVYNHTAEGDQRGPTQCFRGIDNSVYYMLGNDRAYYANYSGCGNTLNSNHAVVRRMILDSLHYWVHEMHVDGFRFDLASVLSRDSTGKVLAQPPVLWDIETDPTLAGTKLIAEAWDAAGLYQVGNFGGDSWREWNGRFRDDVRSFIRGDRDSLAHFADRMVGSPIIYAHEQREPEQSINFVTCHDGFTLNDLVSYNEKHNEANGENNQDGSNNNLSWNCGVEGPTDDPAIEQLRNQQVKNFLATTLLSVGMPMLLMGDEVRRTQQGNNNAYCHDSELTWFDWELLEKHADVRRFVSLLNRRRLAVDLEHDHRRMTLTQLLQRAGQTWHGVRLNQPDWGPDSHSIALTTEVREEQVQVHMILNAYWEPLEFELPAIPQAGPDPWRRWIDTSLASPDDIVDWHALTDIPGLTYRATARSVVVLVADAV